MERLALAKMNTVAPAEIVEIFRSFLAQRLRGARVRAARGRDPVAGRLARTGLGTRGAGRATGSGARAPSSSTNARTRPADARRRPSRSIVARGSDQPRTRPFYCWWVTWPAAWPSMPTGSDAGALVAGPTRGGEFWRAVTALTLHLDVGHLLANLGFGTVFGLLAGQLLGAGVAWATVLAAASAAQPAQRLRAARSSFIGGRIHGGVRDARTARGVLLAAAPAIRATAGPIAGRRSWPA